MQALIIGAGGYIGSRIYHEMKNRKIDVVGTSRKAENNFIKFELGKDEVCNVIKTLKGDDRTAIICAGISNIDRCKSEYETAHWINVTATKELIEGLYLEGFRIVYFSSDQVFDGKKGNYNEGDEVNPINAYGCMKVEVERYLQENVPESCIFRLSKVVDDRQDVKNMFYSWEKQCYQTVYCFKDNLMTCIAMDDVINACILTMQLGLTGVYHLASDQIVIRRRLMDQFFLAMQVANYVIEEKDIEDFGLLEKRPLDTSLNNNKFKYAANYRFISMKELIERYTTNKNERVNRE